MLCVMQSIVISFVVLMLAACSEPLVMIPGKALQGSLQPVPASWDAVPDTIQLETRPSEPYSINIWGVGIAENLYVATRDADWMAHIAADPLVRVRIADAVYELSALAVHDAAEKKRVVQAYVVKYDVDETDGWVEEGTIYRLQKRS